MLGLKLDLRSASDTPAELDAVRPAALKAGAPAPLADALLLLLDINMTTTSFTLPTRLHSHTAAVAWHPFLGLLRQRGAFPSTAYEARLHAQENYLFVCT